MIRSFTIIVVMVLMPVFVLGFFVVVFIGQRGSAVLSVVDERLSVYEAEPVFRNPDYVFENIRLFLTTKDERPAVLINKQDVWSVLVFNNADSFTSRPIDTVFFEDGKYVLIKTRKSTDFGVLNFNWLLDRQARASFLLHEDVVSGELMDFFVYQNIQYLVQIKRLAGICEVCDNGSIITLYRYNKGLIKLFETTSNDPVLDVKDFIRDNKDSLVDKLIEYNTIYK